jgi:hypothetical protein
VARGRVRGVERDVGAARLQHAQQRGHERGGALQADAHARLGPHAQPAQRVGDAVGAPVERGVAHLGPLVDERRRAGRGPHLPFEELVHAQPVRRRAGAAVPGLHRARLAVGGERDPGDAPARAGREAGERGVQVPRHPLDRAALEEIGGVLEGAGEAVAAVLHLQGQLEDGGARVLGQRLHRDAREREGGRGRVDHREHGLHQGRAADVAPRPAQLHDAVEGERRVLLRAQRRGVRAAHQLARGGVAVQPQAQRQRVGEEAHQVLQLGAGPVGKQGAQQEVVLPRVAPQQQRERGRQHGVGGGALAAGQGAHGAGQRRAQLEDVLGAVPPLHRRPRAVGRDLQHPRGAGQLLAPVRLVRRLRR